MKICRTLAVSLAALLMITQAASAQDWQQKRSATGRNSSRNSSSRRRSNRCRAAAAPGGGRRVLAERLCAALAQLLDQHRRLPAHAGELQSRLVLSLTFAGE